MKRATGLTREMVMTLPADALIIVPSHVMADYIKGMIGNLRGEELVHRTTFKVIREMSDVDNLTRQYRGLQKRAVRIDHSFQDAVGRHLFQSTIEVCQVLEGHHHEA